MLKVRIMALALFLAGCGIGYFVYASQAPESRFPFKFGLDLTGGSHLVYEADTSAIPEMEREEAMRALREVIERRVNIFGVSEPIVQVERASVFAESASDDRLIVELPGVTDIDQAVAQIGATPLLEFKLLSASATGTTQYAATGLTGRFVSRASLEFGSTQGGVVANEPIVVLHFNSEGATLFEDITANHVGEQLAIFLDGNVISEPVIREAIAGGVATISGNFSPEEARELVRNLNIGALPVPITLLSTETVGASLGAETLAQGIVAGLYGIGAVMLFMLMWYRLPGLVACISLALYIAIMLALFKLIPVVLTAAGIAGFILSVGMAVDANVLIFERTKEELAGGKGMREAIYEGFFRAWQAIRDGNITTILSAIILFWLGTSVVKGFALTLGIGVTVSMLTAITVSRTFLLALSTERPFMRKLFGTGISS